MSINRTAIHRRAADRPLNLLARCDLRARRMSSTRGTYWTVQDPVSLRTYHFRPEEYFVLQSLDGVRSLTDVQRTFESKFAPRKLELQQIQAFLSTLHREGLIISNAEGQGEVLLNRRNQARRQNRLQAIGNPLAIRLRGFNPDRMLGWLSRKLAWLFSWPVFILASLLLVSSLGLLVAEFDAVVRETAALGRYFPLSNVIWFVVAITCSKMLHELGHALTCRQLGGRCHEIGLMFLVFVPCLYCNVTDAWMLPSKWQRMAVTAAGIVVEILLASFCLWGWWLTNPGPLHQFFLTMTIVCSVNTIFVNGNPLLRFDGYYLLADWLEIPNLAQASSDAWRRVLDWLTAVDDTREVAPSHSMSILLTYGWASFVYRWLVLFAILAGLHALLLPYGLETLAWVVVGLTIFTSVARPMVHDVKSQAARSAWSGRPVWRVFAGRIVLVAIIGFLLCLPFSDRESVNVRLEVADAERVYVTLSGFVEPLVREGDVVEAGQTLAVLENHQIDREIAAILSEFEAQSLHLDQLRRMSTIMDEPTSQIPAAESALADLGRRLEQRQSRRQRLRLISQRAGTVLAAAPYMPERQRGELDGWRGNPLDPQNLGAHLTAGTWFCSVGNPDNVEAIASVEQEQVQRIQVGQTARIRFQAIPGRIFDGRVVEISETSRSDESWSDAETGTELKEDEAMRIYRARIELQDGTLLLVPGGQGVAKIDVVPESLAARCYRYLRRRFAILI